MPRNQVQFFANNSVGLHFHPTSCGVYRIQDTKIRRFMLGFNWFEITPMKIASVYKFSIEILGEWIHKRTHKTLFVAEGPRASARLCLAIVFLLWKKPVNVLYFLFVFYVSFFVKVENYFQNMDPVAANTSCLKLNAAIKSARIQYSPSNCARWRCLNLRNVITEFSFVFDRRNYELPAKFYRIKDSDPSLHYHIFEIRKPKINI